MCSITVEGWASPVRACPRIPLGLPIELIYRHRRETAEEVGLPVPNNAQVPGISDSEMIAMFPCYEIDHDNKHFYRGWLEKRLLMNRCAACHRWHHPPQPLCP